MDYDLLIIGAGPGGYVAAIRAAQLGLKTAIIEKDKPGGVCLNLGCIPSKALIHQAHLLDDLPELRALGLAIDSSGLDYAQAFKKSREAADRLSKGVQYLLKKNSVDYIKATASLLGGTGDGHRVQLDADRVLTAKAVLLATGSRPRQLPGVDFDEERILSSSGALMLERLPKRIAIIGGGAIGIELAYVWNAFGAEVTVLEAQPSILPLEDPEAAALIQKLFTGRGVRFFTGSGASLEAGKRPRLRLTNPEQTSIEADAVLVAIGRSPNSENLGLETLGVSTERGFIPVGPYYQTAASGLYAIGDVINSPLLAHVASKEGELAVEHLAHRLLGQPLPAEDRVDPELVPQAVYCHPELASFGLSAEAAAAQGRPARAYSFPYRAIGKAVAANQSEGFIKLTGDPDSGELLGASIVGEGATDLIHELLLAKRGELTIAEVADMMHAHPSLSEGMMEAAKGFLGRAIHY